MRTGRGLKQRIAIVSDLKRIQFWVVWHDGGSPPTFRHHSKQSALTEAERLAKTCAGEVFFVLKATAGVRAKEPDLERIVFEADPIPF